MIKEKRSVFLFMDERIIEQLENVPTSSEDAYNELISIIENTYCKLEEMQNMKDVFSNEERERLSYELEKIKELGIAKVFVFGVNLYRLGATTSFGVENYSYINYLLGVAELNPVSYSLPFERYFNKYIKFLPVFYMYVEKGSKEKTLKAL
jgi:DNA polymerase III alpha subunit